MATERVHKVEENLKVKEKQREDVEKWKQMINKQQQEKRER